jgi:hypothetical protein
MASYCDGIELKVTGFDKTEEEINEEGFSRPEIVYKKNFEEYYPQTAFSWVDEELELKHDKTTTKITIGRYFVATVIMGNLEKILVDGRCAPYEECFKGHYLNDYFETKSYIIEEIDNETGKVLYKKEIDTTPNIVHNVHKYEEEHSDEFKPITDKNTLLELLELNPRFYDFADESLKEDEDLAFEAVQMYGSNYEHILDKYKQKRDFQLMAVVGCPRMFHYLPKERLEDYDFLLDACKCEKYCLSYIENEELKHKIEKELEKAPRYAVPTKEEQDLLF